jgi:hypothetical protein
MKGLMIAYRAFMLPVWAYRMLAARERRYRNLLFTYPFCLTLFIYFTRTVLLHVLILHEALAS